ncbi:MAG TPA: TonB-dependent receptor [Sphingomonas sp.]
MALAGPAFGQQAQTQTQNPSQGTDDATLPTSSAIENADPGRANQTADQAGTGPQPATRGDGIPEAGPAAESDTIVVTGSRIARAGYDTLQPTTVVDNELIEARGYTNIGEALSEQPAFGAPGSSPVGAQSTFGPAQTFVNFFSLGSQRTLTLVNGRRFVSANTATIFGPTNPGSQVDLNLIPTRLIDRIETIAVGGAPIYGSDAIAGTVNLILRRDFKGLEVDAQYGITEDGDAREYRFRGLAGASFLDDRANLTVSAEYSNAAGLVATDRPLTAAGRFFTAPPASANSPFDQVLFENRRITAFTAGGVPLISPGASPRSTGVGVRDAQGNVVQFGPGGALIPFNFGTATGSSINASGGNGFNLAEVTNLLSPTERLIGTALASFQVADNVRLFGEAWYARTTGTNIVDQPAYNTALFGPVGDPAGPLQISINNPFLTPQARATIAANLPVGQDVFFLSRANTDISTGRATSRQQLYRFVGGLEGNFNVGDREFAWEISGNYGRATGRGVVPELNQQNFLNALNAIRDPSGNIVCAPGALNSPVAALSATCAPLNLFGQGAPSQAARDYITTIARPVTRNTQRTFTASVTGPLFRLPGGNVEVVAGYENRRETTSFEPGAFYEQGLGRSIPISPVSGRFTTNEVFGELRVPIISPDMGLGFIHRLELEGAARWVDHSIAGGALTWTAGARLAPVRDITFRGNFTRSIRAPAITEAFNPSSQAFETANDPCDIRFIGSGPDPARRAANCAAAGVPAGLTSNIVEFTIPVTVAGNANLENEVADSWTVGAIIQPRFLPRFSLAVDWVDIRLNQAIVTLGAEQTLEACFDAPSFPSAICSNVQRDPAGQVTFIQTGFANAASLDFQGLTASMSWRTPLPTFLGEDAELGLSANYLYIDKLEQRVGAGDIDLQRGALGNSKHQATVNATYRNGPFNWLVQGQYTGPAVFDPNESTGTRDPQGVDDFLLFNTTFNWDINDRFGFRFIVNNVADVKPPYPVPGGGGTVTYFPGILGRSFRAGATLRF